MTKVCLGKSRADKAFGPIRTLGRIEAVKVAGAF